MKLLLAGVALSKGWIKSLVSSGIEYYRINLANPYISVTHFLGYVLSSPEPSDHVELFICQNYVLLIQLVSNRSEPVRVFGFVDQSVKLIP